MKRRRVVLGLVALAAAVLAGERCIAHHRAPGGGSHAEAVGAYASPVAARRTDPRMQARGSISGTVRDPAGAPIPAARVCAHARSSDLPGELTRDLACSRADARGAYRIGELRAAEYLVTAMAKRFAPVRETDPSWVPLAAGEHRTQDVVLAPGGVELTGAIKDAGGGGIVRASVRIAESSWWFEPADLMVETDASGRYSAWVRPGPVVVAATADGYATAKVSGDAPSVVDLQLLPESTLGGVVIDETGQPVAGASVSLNIVDPSPRSTIEDEVALTDDAGRFRITRLEAGRYVANARTAHGYGESAGTTALGLGAHVDDVVVRLAPAHQVVARVVVEPERTPCPKGVLASLIDEVHGRGYAGVEQPDHTLRFDGVLPGTYDVSPGCADFVPRTYGAYPKVVVGDRDVADLEWPVAHGGEITGRVLVNGAPVADVRVDAMRISTRPRDQVGFGVNTTSAAGEFHVTGLLSGRYKVEAALPGGVSGLGITAEVEVGTTVVHRDLVMDRALGSLTGRAAIRGSSDSTYVHISGADTSALAAVDDGGRFRFPYLPAGAYTINLENRWQRIGDEHPVVVTAGRETTIELGADPPPGQITGRVIDDPGAPVADVFVVAAPEDANGGGALDMARQDSHAVLVHPDGTFALSGLSDGKYTVRAGRRTGPEGFAMHVTTGAAIVIRIGATGGIAGTVRGGPQDLVVTTRDGQSRATLREERFAGADRFEILDLPAGRYLLDVSSGTARRAITVDVTEGATTAVDVALTGVATVVGRAVDARTGEPVGWLQISATARATGNSYSAPDYRNVTEADGRFELVGVPRGVVAIEGWSRDPERSLTIATTYRTIPETGAVIDVGDIGVLVERHGEATGSIGFDLGPLEPAGHDGDGLADRVVRVASVTADGPADRAGLVAGDVIDAIDGFDVTGVNVDRAPVLLPGRPGTQRVLALHRGDTITIQIIDPH